MATFKYRTEKYSTTIAVIECVSETAKRAVIREAIGFGRKPIERTVAKVSDYARYHDSWDEARDFLLVRTENRIERAEEQLNRVRAEREAIHALRRPQEVA